MLQQRLNKLKATKSIAALLPDYVRTAPYMSRFHFSGPHGMKFFFFDSERNDLVWSVNLLYTSHGVQIGPLPPPLLCPIISHVCVEEVTYISDALPPHASILVDVVGESLFGKPTATHHRPFCVSRYVPQIDISWESK